MQFCRISSRILTAGVPHNAEFATSKLCDFDAGLSCAAAPTHNKWKECGEQAAPFSPKGTMLTLNKAPISAQY
jgi:hypothetical protein